MTDPNAYLGPVANGKKERNNIYRKPSQRIGYNHQDTIAILAFDPGGTTGFSHLVLPREIDGKDVFSHRLTDILAHKTSWSHGELWTSCEEDEASAKLIRMCVEAPNAAIVSEDFILAVQRKEKSRELLSPVRITARIEYAMWQQQRRVFKQTPSQAKTTITDQRLQAFRCYAQDGMADHARDADRHVLLFLRRCLGPQGVPLKRVAWPWIYMPGFGLDGQGFVTFTGDIDDLGSNTSSDGSDGAEGNENADGSEVSEVSSSVSNDVAEEETAVTTSG